MGRKQLDRKIFVVDNTVLSNFHIAGELHILKNLWGQLLVLPLEVVKEFELGFKEIPIAQNPDFSSHIVFLSKEENSMFSKLSRRLGRGESACLAICIHRNGVFVSDDRDARSKAKSLNIPVIGTLGILVNCIKRKIIQQSRAQQILEQMIEAGYRSPVSKIKEIFEK